MERADSGLAAMDGDDLARASLKDRVLDAWADMRASTRRLLREEPSEARLLFYVMLSDIIFFLSWTIKTVVAPTAAAQAKLPAQIGMWLVLALLARTSFMYALAAGLRIVCRVFGGAAGWWETRLAVFWGALVSAPFGLAAALLTVAMSWFEDDFPILRHDMLALPPYYVGLIPFLFFISSALAEVHGFRRMGFLFMGLSVAAVALSVFTVYLAARGVV
ncbi:YIP1 family protein [Oceanicella actignis]|uniref:YIP1 family protein n=1 Tax=Oceanicella actignis TaxID=1189325 RepID=UPI0011E6A36B|nr:YIP1 family protein [Oceanicella actignis]TYO88484.1 hypothetical protein LY05_02144 [Oceanicella actignis]